MEAGPPYVRFPFAYSRKHTLLKKKKTEERNAKDYDFIFRQKKIIQCEQNDSGCDSRNE